MLRHLPLIVLITFIIACKSDEQKFADEQYDQFKSLIADDSLNASATSYAAFIAANHYDDKKKNEAQNWLNSYKKNEDDYNAKKKIEEEKTKSRLEIIGGYKIVEVDSKTKCNLYKGIYRLNKMVIDSADLAFLAKYLANQLFINGQKAADCSYPVMSQAFIYQPTAKEREDWASMCSITPRNYEGDVFVKMNITKQ
jgi:hypothetical protein